MFEKRAPGAPRRTRRGPGTPIRRKRPPRTRAPQTGWLLKELAQLCNLPLRTLRYYAERGIIRPLELRGRATRYPRREFLRVLKLLRMRLDGYRRLDDIRRRLDATSDPDLEAWAATEPLLSASTLAALGLSPPPTAAPASGIAPTSASGVAPTSASGVAPTEGLPASIPTMETWQRLRLMPGLELMLSADASLEARTFAASLYADCLKSFTTRR